MTSFFLLGVLTAWGLLGADPSTGVGGRLDATYRPRFEQHHQPFRLHPFPDGRLLLEVGPDVVEVSGTEVRRLARLSADGSIDPGFAAPTFLTDAFFHRLFPQPDGGVYVNLSPLPFGSDARWGVVHLTPDGRRDEGFRLPAKSESDSWRLMTVQPDGRLLVVRDPTEPTSGSRQELVRLLPSGEVDPSFTCAVNDGRTFAAAGLLEDGRIAVRYLPKEVAVAGFSGSLWCRLEPGGDVDRGYQPPAELSVPVREAVGRDGSVYLWASEVGPNGDEVGPARGVHLLPNGTVNPDFRPPVPIWESLGVTGEGHWRVLTRESVGGSPSWFLIELDETGAVAFRRWLPEVVQDALSLEVVPIPGDNLLVLFTSLLPPGTGESPEASGRSGCEAWLFSPADVVLGFNSPQVTSAVTPYRPASFPDGTLLIPKSSPLVDSVDHQLVSGTAVLSPTGQLDLLRTRWFREDDTVTYSAAPDGRILAHDSKSGWLAWIESDGTKRPIAIASQRVRSLRGYQLQSDLSQIVVKDEVSRVSPQDPGNPRTVRTDTPQGGTVGQVLTDDRILLWGPFTGVAGWISPGLARLLPSLDPDRSFRSSLPPGTRVQAAFAQRDGRVVVAVDSQTDGAPTHADILRLSEDGTPDPGFRSPGRVDGAVHAVSVDHQGRILLGGAFRRIGSVSSASVIRLKPDGTVDESFVRGEGANGPVHALFVQPDDGMVVFGNFRRFDGEERWGLARLNGGRGALEPRVLGVSSSGAVPLGQRVAVGAVTAGEPPLTFQWYRFGKPMDGQTNVSLVLPAFSSADVGSYELRVGNRHGSVISPPCELRVAEPKSEAPILSLVPRRYREATVVLLGLAADPLGKHRLEGSSDLVTWSPVDLDIPVNAFVENLGQGEPAYPFLRVVSGK